MVRNLHVVTPPKAVPDPRLRPWTVVAAAVIVAVEALAYVALAVLDLASISPERVAVGAGVALFFLIYGFGQWWATYSLFRLNEWARGALLFTQLVQLGLAWNVRAASQSWLPWLLAVPAAVCLLCLIAPVTNRALLTKDPM